MGAFNSRFKPTLWLVIFTPATLGFGLFGLILLIFSVSALIQIKSIFLSAVLAFGALSLFILSMKEYRSMANHRIKFCINAGARDRKNRTMEL